MSATTWVIWRYDWPFKAGNHTLEVRSVDGESTPQIEKKMGNRPSGATNIQERKASL